MTSPETTSALSSERPLVSVILTSYNYERFLAQAVGSVFSQTYRPLELIAIDDGSTDSSPEILGTMSADSPIPFRFILQENRGQAAAWNRAFLEVRGEIVCFLDSDDYWSPAKVETMVRFIQDCAGRGGVFQHHLENERGEKKQKYLSSGDFFADWKAMGRINLALFQGRISPFVPTSGLVFLKSVLDTVFPVPEELVTCPDAFLTRTSSAFGPVQSHPAVLGCWREHDENAGKRSAFGYHEFWIPVIMPILNRWYREQGIPIELYYRKRGLIREGMHHLATDPANFVHYFKGFIRKKFGSQ